MHQGQSLLAQRDPAGWGGFRFDAPAEERSCTHTDKPSLTRYIVDRMLREGTPLSDPPRIDTAATWTTSVYTLTLEAQDRQENRKQPRDHGRLVEVSDTIGVGQPADAQDVGHEERRVSLKFTQCSWKCPEEQPPGHEWPESCSCSSGRERRDAPRSDGQGESCWPGGPERLTELSGTSLPVDPKPVRPYQSEVGSIEGHQPERRRPGSDIATVQERDLCRGRIGGARRTKTKTRHRGPLLCGRQLGHILIYCIGLEREPQAP